ncbi:MAG TPA: glycosyltransferase family 25 protein [Bryobacteraceae bacterium]|nr:glycosyltransferase family 25 protein [Bryobacteraceae bacterium]
MPQTNPGLLTAEGLLDILEKTDPASEFVRAAAGVLDRHLTNGRLSAPAPAPRSANKQFLTVAMATYDDYDGVFFSVQAIRLYHPEITSETEILVIDNHPGGPCSDALKGLESHVAGYRCIPVGDRSGTAIRDVLFREADSEYVLVMDSHVLFAPGSLARLIRVLKSQPAESRDLWQGPLLYDDLRTVSTHFSPEWSAGMYGVWGCDERGLDPDGAAFEIPMQGLGVFVGRKDAWVGLNPRLRGFGGEEGFLHEKVRQNGGKVFCLPFLRWNHRFGRPLGTRYCVSWEDRVRNYLIEYDELGLDPAPAIEHFEKLLGVENTRRMVEAVQKEIAGPFHFFDAIYCINLDREKDRWELVTKRFEELGIANRVQRFPAIETPLNHHVGCALSHRSIVANAKKHGFRNVLVFEDDVVFASDTIEALGRSIRELRRVVWDIFYLGGHAWGQSFERADGCFHLEKPRGLTCTHAVAYHESIYERILSEVPATPTGVALWLRKEHGIDQYFSNMPDCLKLLTSPVVASQLCLLSRERPNFDAGITHLSAVEPIEKEFTIQAFGCSITVIADCEEALAVLEQYLLPSLPRTSSNHTGSEIVLKVLRQPQGFQISCDRASGTPPDQRSLIVEAVRLLDEAILKRLTGLAAVHAGVVRIGGQTVLLPGKTNIGKSALVAELLRRGAEYLSDEYALIDASGHAHPYPRPLLLRNPGPEQVAALPQQWNARISEAPAPVGWILALEYDPAACWHVTPVPQSEAVLILLRNTPHVLIDEPQTFDAFQRASCGARCYEGWRNEAPKAAEHILQLVSA